MNTSSINGLSLSHMQTLLSHQLTTNSLNNSSAKNANGATQSPFAQLMSDVSNAANQSAPQAAKSNSFLQQLMSMV